MKLMLIVESTMPHAMIYDIPNTSPTLGEAMGAGGGHIPIMLLEVQTIGHDIRSTQFARGGCSDPLTSTDYKEPPIVCYESIPKDISVTLREDEQRI